MISDFTVRQLEAWDWPAFKAIRLQALTTDNDFIGIPYDQEAAMTDDQWEKRVTPTADMRYFGLFNHGDLIGMMRCALWDEDTSGRTALWGGAYIKPEYRGQGLAKPLYMARAKWSATRYDNAVMYIKEDNARSAGIHLANGAEFAFSRVMERPDRPPALWHWYRVQLAQQKSLAA